jgi:hypothetical protein
VLASDSLRTYLRAHMAKTATKKKPPKQADLFDAAPRKGKSNARKSAARSAAKSSARAKTPSRSASAESGYTAKHIEVLEGLEQYAVALACILAAPMLKLCTTCLPR